MNYDRSPYRKIPEELMSEYSMGGECEIIYERCEDQSKPTTDIRWTKEKILEFQALVSEEIPSVGYPHENGAGRLREALSKYDLSQSSVAVIGSTTPWIEAILLNLKCKSITTVEYNPVISEHENIKSIHWNDFEAKNIQYDHIVSYSSIEHSGLGRYGDPLNPNGDIEAMQVIREKMKVKGVLFLAVPRTLIDKIEWNLHRQYGPKRWPILIEGFEEILNPIEHPNRKLQPVNFLQKKCNT